MAELLVFTVDKTNADDPFLDARLPKRGDVVTICPDSWPWSQHEQSGNPFLVVKLPGVPEAKLAGFLAEEPGDLKIAPHRLRAFRFDLEAWQAGGAKALSENEGLALKTVKPALPSVDIGATPDVIE